MGKGSIGNLASAATCAASSFEMKVRDPRELLDRVDQDRFQRMLASSGLSVEEQEGLVMPKDIHVVVSEPQPQPPAAGKATALLPPPPPIENLITGRVQLFGEHVDTVGVPNSPSSSVWLHLLYLASRPHHHHHHPPSGRSHAHACL